MLNLCTPDGRLLGMAHCTLSVQPLCRDHSIPMDTKPDIGQSRPIYFHDEYDTWQIEQAAERGCKHTEQESVEILGWYLQCSGEVICEVRNREQGIEVIREVAFLCGGFNTDHIYIVQTDAGIHVTTVHPGGSAKGLIE